MAIIVSSPVTQANQQTRNTIIARRGASLKLTKKGSNVLCNRADRGQIQIRLALTAAAEQIGVATYQTALPDEQLMSQRLKQIVARLEGTS